MNTYKKNSPHRRTLSLLLSKHTTLLATFCCLLLQIAHADIATPDSWVNNPTRQPILQPTLQPTLQKEQKNLFIRNPFASGKSQYLPTKKNQPLLDKQNPPFVSYVVSLHFANSTELADAIRQAGLLSPSGKLVINSRTNSLWVSDAHARLEKILLFSKQWDTMPPSIRIRAVVASIDTQYLRALGLQWQTTTTPTLDSKQLFAFTLAKITHQQWLTGQLEALEKQGFGKILARPHLITLNRHTASIESGEEIPYQEKTSSGATSTNFKKAVLGLTITPTVINAHSIRLKLTIHQDKISSVQFNGTPGIHTQQLDTEVIAATDQMLVLGGIFENTQSTQIHRVPFLGHIPLLGLLFRHKETRHDTRALLVFITPSIVNPSAEI